MHEGDYIRRDPNGPYFWRGKSGEIGELWRPVGKTTFVKGPVIEGARYDPKAIFSPKGCNAFLLGMDGEKNEYGCHWTPTKRQGHGLTFGTSRQGGKGTTTIIPALLTYAGSMVVIDPKGENAWITAPRRRALGQRVVIIDPWGEVNRRYGKLGGAAETITRFNPLSALRPDDPELADHIAAIADALIIPGGNDPHWADSAGELIAGLIAAEIEYKSRDKASLRGVRDHLTLPEADLVAVIASIVADRPGSLAARKLGRFTKVTGEMSSIKSSALTQTAILDGAAMRDGMETDTTPFDLAEVAARPTTVYLVIPPDRLQTHGRWLRMILTLMIKAVSRQDRPPKLPVVFMVDEAGTLNPVKGGGLKMLEQAFGLLAGLGVVVWMFFQDLNQMKRDYPDSWETFIANSAMIQVLNARDNTTAGYFSEYFGETTTYRQAVYKEQHFGERVITPFQGYIKGKPMPINEYVRPAHTDILRDEDGFPKVLTPEHYAKDRTLTPQALRHLTGSRHELVIFPGSDNYWCNKVPYYANPGFKGMFRPDPRYAKR